MAKFKEFFNKFKGTKKLEIAVAIVLVVVILFIYFSTFKTSVQQPDEQTIVNASTDYCANLESKLNEVLSSVKGAGKVRAVIHFETSIEILIAYIETYGEQQSSKTPQVLNVNGSQVPLILKEIYPKVKGVLITAQGASDPKVKIELISCASVLLAISTNIIHVATGA